MYRQGTHEMTFREVVQAIEMVTHMEDLPKPILPLTLEELTSNVLTSFFFSKAPNKDSIRFAHKSFMDFFVASYIARSVIENRPIELFEETVPSEISYFLHSMTQSRAEVRAAFGRLLRDTLRSNESGGLGNQLREILAGTRSPSLD